MRIARSKLSWILIFSMILLSPLSSSAALTELWSIKSTFNMPESAAFDPQSQQIFVSNVNHYAKDGNGFVSRVSADGKDIELKWLDGLDSPTGLTVNNGLLYVVDYDQLLVADIGKQKIIQRISSPDKKPALNDVTVSKSGEIFVTGSASATIYKVEDESLVVWFKGDDLLKHANGVLIDGANLVYGGYRWLEFELASKQVRDKFEPPKPEIIEIDGITFDGCGGYLITLIDDKRIWQVTKSGTARPISEVEINGIDIQQSDGLLYTPQVGGGLAVFRITADLCNGED